MSEVFDQILNNRIAVRSSATDYKAPSSIPQRYHSFYEHVVNSVFPSKEEDLHFFRLVWDDIEPSMSFWRKAVTKEYRLFSSLIRGSISLEEFCDEVDDSLYIIKLREYIFNRCFDLTKNDDGILFNSFVSVNKQNPQLNLYTFDFETNDPSKFVDMYTKYYSELGYNIKNGVTLKEDSHYINGAVELTPQLFNTCLFPWTLEGRKVLPFLGWKRDDLLNELINLKYITKDEGYSLYKLTKMYRKATNSDCYIDWKIVLKYKFLKYSTLLKIARKTFGVSRDMLEGLSYEEVVHRLAIMSDKSANISKLSTEMINTSNGIIDGVKRAGYSYIFSSKIEGKEGSFWYPNLEGRMALMHKGNVIIQEDIVVAYKVYLWAKSKGEDVSVGYFIYLSQLLGVWYKILEENRDISSKIICEEIDNVLTSTY